MTDSLGLQNRTNGSSKGKKASQLGKRNIGLFLKSAWLEEWTYRKSVSVNAFSVLI